jgi:flagellar basal-body rod protein FlgF
MENTLLIGLSRHVTLERQMDAVANNIANINTTGYKANRSLFQEYLRSGAHEDNFVGRDRRVSYVTEGLDYQDFTSGAFEQTKNPLDVAVDGGGFLAVQTPAGERYTRDGNLQINSQGQLVTAVGNPVLGANGPITFQPTDHDVTITQDGTITVVQGNGTADTVRGKLRLVSFNNPQGLLKEGANLYATGQATSQPDLRSTIRQGFIEKSNVNALAEMSRMIEVSRAYQQMSTLLQQEGDLHKTAIQQLADVPA